MAANRAVAPLLEGVAAALLAPPVNVLRLSLDPDGLAPRIVNFAEWRAHLLERLAQQAAGSADAALVALHAELAGLPLPQPNHRAAVARPADRVPEGAGVFVPLQLETAGGVLTLLSTTTVFGTPVDVTLAELALECFFPADAATAESLHRAARPGGQ